MMVFWTISKGKEEPKNMVLDSCSCLHFIVMCRPCEDNGKAGPTAHGLARVELLSHEELLQLPDVHPGLDHGLRVPLGGGPRRRPIIASWDVVWRRGEEMWRRDKEVIVMERNHG